MHGTARTAPADRLELAVEYLLAVRRGDDAEMAEAELARLDAEALRRALHDEASKLAFWIDVYNGAVLRHPAPAADARLERLRYFRRTVVVVAGQPLSLDTIEHGLLRRSQLKLGLGYVGAPRRSRFEREHRVRRVDPRIHFALNCGAASCPPIAAYRAEHIDQQLDLATRSYLAGEVAHEHGRILLPALMLWYAGDFGGARGIRRFLRDHGVAGWNRAVRFRPYDWTPTPDNWAAELQAPDQPPASPPAAG
jgi:hypothetical protein